MTDSYELYMEILKGMVRVMQELNDELAADNTAVQSKMKEKVIPSRSWSTTGIGQCCRLDLGGHVGTWRGRAPAELSKALQAARADGSQEVLELDELRPFSDGSYTTSIFLTFPLPNVPGGKLTVPTRS